MLIKRMKMITGRAVLTVRRCEGGWTVEVDGEIFAQTTDPELARAAVNRRALDIQATGRACQVRVIGENGFHPIV